MQQIFILANVEGLHFRPASRIIEICRQASCSVQIIKGDQSANPLSMMSLLKLGVRCGEPVTVIAEGQQAQEIVTAIGQILESS
ncbi:HPr family phosphocarrier protein [Paenibacillus pinistramenti]|uniref:HPr family phosphocarrier protein n=1 Tax=Paenibacillus pinistramenti TaxID=1768003 RepID=UPI0011099B15|nr:HPr family phosphocarrier protein [Paenibacillus pinistramenti]